jgi:hypothetical protein
MFKHTKQQAERPREEGHFCNFVLGCMAHRVHLENIFPPYPVLPEVLPASVSSFIGKKLFLYLLCYNNSCKRG